MSVKMNRKGKNVDSVLHPNVNFQSPLTDEKFKLFFAFFFDLLSLFQDILENESINLDWMFRYSLINDIVKVSGLQAADTVNTPTRRQRQQIDSCVFAWAPAKGCLLCHADMHQ